MTRSINRNNQRLKENVGDILRVSLVSPWKAEIRFSQQGGSTDGG